MKRTIKSIVDKNNGYLEIGGILLPNGENEEGMPDGEYFELLAIEKSGDTYICLMDCDNNEEWLLDDIDDESLAIILEEIQ